jgi:hypothetical protein
MQGVAPLSDAFQLRQASAPETACGGDDSYCGLSIEQDFLNRFKQEPCAIQTSASDNERSSNYNLYLAPYQKKPCDDDAFRLCDTTQRFGPNKVLQDSFLKGLGQVTGSRECFASKLNYMAEDIFPETQPKKTGGTNMELFAQPTVFKKSCGSVSEVDLRSRYHRLPGAYAGAFTPIFSRQSLVPNALSESVTLSSKKYPEFGDIKAMQDAHLA